MLFSTSSATAFRGLLCESVTTRIAFQSSPIRSCPFEGLLAATRQYCGDTRTTASVSGRFQRAKYLSERHPMLGLCERDGHFLLRTQRVTPTQFLDQALRFAAIERPRAQHREAASRAQQREAASRAQQRFIDVADVRQVRR